MATRGSGKFTAPWVACSRSRKPIMSVLGGSRSVTTRKTQLLSANTRRVISTAFRTSALRFRFSLAAYELYLRRRQRVKRVVRGAHHGKNGRNGRNGVVGRIEREVAEAKQCRNDRRQLRWIKTNSTGTGSSGVYEVG